MVNVDNLQYRQNEVDFFGETYATSGHKSAGSKVLAITAMPSPTNNKQVIHWHDQLFVQVFAKIVQACRTD